MPDLPTISGGPAETASSPATSAGNGLTGNATANTKATTWTELMAATTYDSDWLLITLDQVAATSAFLVDIGVGASTAEQVLIGNLYLQSPAAGAPSARVFLFPLRIAAGSRISARCQSNPGGSSCRIALTAIASGISAPPGLTRVETIGANTADSNGVSVDPGGTANTDAIGQLTASSGFAYKWMCLAVGNPTDTAWVAARSFLADVVIGASGSEVEVIGDLAFSGAQNDDHPSPGAVCFPCAIAAGSRVGVRLRCNVTTAGERVLDFVGYGVG